MWERGVVAAVARARNELGRTMRVRGRDNMQACVRVVVSQIARAHQLKGVKYRNNQQGTGQEVRETDGRMTSEQIS